MIMDIPTFFNWLQQNIAKLPHDSEAQRDLSKRLSELNPELRWEIGPGERAEHFLAFSPALKRELLDYTRMLVREAPEIDGWEFLSAKPKKRWTNRKIRIISGGRCAEYRFVGWKYYLTSFNDGEFFDVNVVPVGYEQEAKSDLEYAASLIVESKLGEELFIDAVDRVNIVLPKELKQPTDSISDLYKHIMYIRRPNEIH